MARLGDIAHNIRSKNAGPFWITIDIFCASDTDFKRLCADINDERMAALLNISAARLKRFDIDDIAVIKFSFRREHVQGSRFDRDMHGAQIAVLCADMEI